MNNSDSLNRYFKSIKDLNPLTKEEERDLVIKMRNGCRASMDKLIKHNLKIVVVIANKNKNRGILVEDLIQQGNMGLYESVIRFNPDFGVRLASFASTRILKMMNSLIDQCGRTVRIPVNQEYRRYLAIKSGKEVDNLNTIRLDSILYSDSKETLKSRLKIEYSEDNKELLDTLQIAFKSLNEREKLVISLFFGLETGEKINQTEIGKKLGITNVTVSNIKKKAIEKLKKYYN